MQNMSQVNKAPNKMCETDFLQMCSFSIILTSLHSLNLSFPTATLHDFYCYTLLSTLIPCISTLISQIPWIPALIARISCISTQITRIPSLISCIPITSLAFPPLFSPFPLFYSSISHFGFYRQPAQFVILNLF